MNKKYLTLTAIALATLSLSAVSAFAEDAPQSPPPADMHKDGKGADFEKRGKEMFDKTDADKDGYLSKAEMEASQKERLEEMFDKTDVDKDGKLSPDELKKGREEMREKFRAKFKEHRKDGKGDGKPEAKVSE